MRWEDLIKTGNGERFSPQERNRAARLRGMLVSCYPSTETEVMPTRFGNIIRSFEVYPRQVYGADGVPIWLRLASVIPKEFAGLLEDARAQVDCFVNLANLAFLITLACVTGSLASADWQHLTVVGQSEQRYLLMASMSLVVCALSYWLTTVRAMAWGDLVRSAFDCYLPALIRQLGYAVPSTDAERREFWSEFNALVLYQQPMTGLTPVSWRDESLGSGSLALRHVVLRFRGIL